LRDHRDRAIGSFVFRQDVPVTPTKTRRSRARALLVAGLLLPIAAAAAGCGAVHPVADQAVTQAAPAPSAGGSATRVTVASGRAAGWVAVARRAVPSSGPVRVTFSQVQTADGSVITIATFHGPVQYVLHDGSEDPGPLAGPVAAGPAVTGPGRARLLAAFNGGFKLDALAGGYEQEGHVVRAIRTGLASLVIDTSGQATVGVWGHGVPVAGEAVYSVRQNLWALVAGGKPTAESALWWRWGGTLGHAEYVARSALGENAAGELMYAASMSATPADLADALAGSGARIAMELDINPEWVQLDAANHPGGPLSAVLPGQVRPATQYLTGWTRDFIAVLAPSAAENS
jgi:hypothetical protein